MKQATCRGKTSANLDWIKLKSPVLARDWKNVYFSVELKIIFAKVDTSMWKRFSFSAVIGAKRTNSIERKKLYNSQIIVHWKPKYLCLRISVWMKDLNQNKTLQTHWNKSLRRYLNHFSMCAQSFPFNCRKSLHLRKSDSVYRDFLTLFFYCRWLWMVKWKHELISREMLIVVTPLNGIMSVHAHQESGIFVDIHQ